MSCPYTSPQNGKVERMIHAITNLIRTPPILGLPACYWDEGLATYLLNRLPSKAANHPAPFFALFGIAHPIRISTPLVVHAILTPSPPLPTNFRPDPFAAFSSG